MDYKLPQNATPVQNGTPAPQYSSPQPQYGQPTLQQHGVQYGEPQHPSAQPGQPAQYQAQAPMQRAVVAPAAKGGDWSASLMDCSPCDSCLLATFLPCILLGKTADRMRDPSMASANALNSECLAFTVIQCITGCGWIYVMMKRSEIRERYGIQGGGTDDCCATYWCACCALIQQDKEVKVRTSNAAGLVTQGYQTQAGMQM